MPSFLITEQRSKLTDMSFKCNFNINNMAKKAERINKYLLLAIREAKKSPIKYQKHCAVIIDSRGRIISYGYNKYRTDKHVVGASIHAEVNACLQAPKDKLRGAIMFIIRINKQGEIKCSKPCANCEKVIMELGITKVYYT